MKLDPPNKPPETDSDHDVTEGLGGAKQSIPEDEIQFNGRTILTSDSAESYRKYVQ